MDLSVEIKDNQLAFNYNDRGDSYYDEEFIMELGKDNMKKLADFIYEAIGEKKWVEI